MIKNNPFGFNIALPRKSIQEVQKVVKQEIENFTVNPFVQYFEETEKVFSGEAAKELQRCQSQIYALGQIMREGQPTTTFNVKI